MTEKGTLIIMCLRIALNFYTKAEILCLVPCCIMVMHLYQTRYQFLSTVLCLSNHQVNVPSYNDWSTNNKDCHTLLVPMEASRYGLGSIQFPSLPWQFCGIPGWAHKRAGKSKWQFNCLYLDGLYRCNGLELTFRLTGVLYSYAVLCCFMENIFWGIIKFFGTSLWLKSLVPLTGIKPDASCIPGECPYC